MVFPALEEYGAQWEFEQRKLKREKLEEKERRWKEGDIGNWTEDQVEKLFIALGGKGVAGRIVAGVTLVSVDEVVRVNRSVSLKCPDWAELVYPELESVGPAEYPISRVGLWLHEYQKLWHGASGRTIYDRLRETGLLKKSLGFSDLEAIQNTSVAFFREHFKDKTLWAWKSVIRHRSQSGPGGLLVPNLSVENKQELVVSWDHIGYQFNSNSPCPIFCDE
jgi:hypothetical protein